MNLIELMVSSVLSLFLLAVTISFYQQQRNNYAHQENIAILQENARFATHILQSEIQIAGYMGCQRLDENIHKDMLPIEGTENTVIISHMDTQSTELKTAPKKGDIFLDIASDKGFKKDDEIIIADCVSMQKVIIVDEPRGILKIKPKLAYNFTKEAQVGRWVRSKFEIIDKKLYWKDFGRLNAPAAMVEGIEKMVIQYSRFEGKISHVQIALLLTADTLQREWNMDIVLRERL
ncbi:MAG: PilW family protein [Gammaproteobacteria bacterium]